MNKKRSNNNRDSPEDNSTGKRRRFKGTSVTRGSSRRTTETMVLRNRNRPEELESPNTTPFNQHTVLPLATSILPLTVHQAGPAINDAVEASSTHKCVQSNKAVYDQSGVTAEKHYQDLQNTQVEGLERNGFQCNLRPEGTYLFADDDGQKASLDKYDESNAYSQLTQSGVTLVGDFKVAQFPVQNHMFQGAQKVDIGGDTRFINIARDNVTNHWHDRTYCMERLEGFVSFAAQFDSSAQDPERVCHTGTRENVLERIKNWIDNPSSTEPIFWLHGPAGAGKSAIAQTIATLCDQQKVVATFFFYRSDADRNDGNMLFTTLAYQLTNTVPAIKNYIFQSLHDRPDLPTKSIEIQFNGLISLPYQSLSKAASQKSSPADVIAAFNNCQQLAPIIIIDGVDECKDEALQQRFLKTIGDAVKDRSLPFRFLICSRSEAHIENTLNKFKASIFGLDLAKEEADRDIEKYLVDQFSCIASHRNLSPTWPGRNFIKEIVYKSSGNFILAFVVIKFASDEDSMPKDQIAIIMNLKPPDRMSPFAVLDELYLEILKRQPYPDFLKTFLALLIGRTALSRKNCNLHKDDAKLMGVFEEELHTKLRRMRSLLKFKPNIDVHHRSFLDFLKESSRSGDYHISTQGGIKRYLELVVESIVRYASRVIQNTDYHGIRHFDLSFRNIIWDYPLKNKMPTENLQAVSQPLVEIQDKILGSTDPRIANDLLSCDKCAIFNVMRPILSHLAIYGCIKAANDELGELATEGQYSDIISSTQLEAAQNASGNELQSSMFSLLSQLRETKLELSPAMIDDAYSILRFDCAEIAMQVRSTSDAQKLADFLLQLIDEKSILCRYKPDGLNKAARLILNVFVRIPILPRSLLLNVRKITSRSKIRLTVIGVVCKAALMWRLLDRNYIHLGMNLQMDSLHFSDPSDSEKLLPLNPIMLMEIVLGVAKGIQYLHSMGVAPGEIFDLKRVYFDPSQPQRVRIAPEYSTIINPFTSSTLKRFSYEGSVFAFGCFFYHVYFNENVSGSTDRKRSIVAKRPSKLKISEHAWQLIQRCCAKDPKNQPTIDEVVKEMEAWGNQPE